MIITREFALAISLFAILLIRKLYIMKITDDPVARNISLVRATMAKTRDYILKRGMFEQKKAVEGKAADVEKTESSETQENSVPQRQ
jgi:hypothetical protein